MSSFRIDYVWSSVDVISNFISYKTVQLTSTLTDHAIVILYIENFLDVKNNKRNIPLKKVYDFDKMTEDNWAAFAKKTDALANGCYLHCLNNKTVLNQNMLNQFWDLLQECIIKTALSIIPSYQSKEHHTIKRPPLLSKLYKNLKLLYKLKRLVKKIEVTFCLPQHWCTLVKIFTQL
ncbi:1854_t:CDS:1 [Funneliformis geosporum]|uniref:1854_t:CDS:1 n=1 Tax=Funneliformis geosporum TaxID=1117311 RepID=A0A9W4SYP4_9GLOM|nr:1854_t:CDS:1 [Funneliformis geosporum]